MSHSIWSPDGTKMCYSVRVIVTWSERILWSLTEQQLRKTGAGLLVAMDPEDANISNLFVALVERFFNYR